MRWQFPMRYSIMTEGTVREMIADNMRSRRPFGVFSYRFMNYSISDNGEVKEILIEAESSILAFYICKNVYRKVSSSFIQL